MKQFSEHEHWELHWCSFSRSRRVLAKKVTIVKLTEIRDVTYGADSSNFARQASKLEDEPWTCFSVQTDSRSFDFAAGSSRDAMKWVEVLLFLTGRVPRGVGRFLWKSAAMRMKKHSTTARRCLRQA